MTNPLYSEEEVVLYNDIDTLYTELEMYLWY